jgi:ribonuclease R
MPKSPYPRSDRELIQKIQRSPGSKAGYKQLVREFGLGGGRERRLLLEQLTRLVARGELKQAGDNSWTLPAAPTSSDEPSSSPSRRQAQETDSVRLSRSGRDHLVSGRLDLHRDGFGFVRPEASAAQPRSENSDIFIPPNEINGAMQGDLVLVDEAPPGRDGRRSGRIARVLTRRNPTVVGIFHYARPQRRGGYGFADARGNFIVPIDERLGSAIEIPEGAEVVAAAPGSPHRTLGDEARPRAASEPPAIRSAEDSRWPLEGLAVDVEITSFAQPGRPARGRVIEVLGHPDDFGVDVEIIIRKHAIPHAFPPAVLHEANQQAEQTVTTLTPNDLAPREDFRGLPIVTIDGETARDFDDAVLVRPLPNGHTELQVHIADVSWYVRPESPLDTEARVRGTSVYFPDRAVPMLPHALSSGMCSLLPNEDRLVLSCIMDIDPAGEIAGFRVAEGIIRSARRMTYTSVQHCLNASPQASIWNAQASITADPTAEDFAERERLDLEHPDLPAAFDEMLQLALKLNAKRQRRGSIDFDLPEPVVEFDPDGNMKAIVRSERGWSHRLIEEFMLSANECVATWLESQGIPSIYRIHEMPDPKRIVDFEETAAAFGQTLGIGSLPVRKLPMKSDRRDSQRRSARGSNSNTRGRDSRPAQSHELPASIPVTPQMYQRLVRRISGHPEERILAYLMLRSLKQARYAEQNEGHFALASPSYTHFTSPIRRYPDLIVHRLVREMLQRGANPHGGAIRSTDKQPWQHELDRSRGKQDHHKAPTSRSALAQNDPIPAEELNDIAVESSQAERRAADAERELIEWKKMKFMADKVGDDFRAIILSITKYGFFVELDEMFIEGLVPITSLTGDYYTFRDTDRTICGARSGHCFRIGERVEVILDRIDRLQRRLQFALLPGTEPKPEPSRRPSPETIDRKPSPKRTSKAKARLRKAKRKR